MGGRAEFLHSANRARKDDIHGSLACETAACGKTQKGRDQITPSLEAPRSAYQESAPSHAQGWAQALRLGLLRKIRGFRARPQPEATQIVMLGSLSYWLADRSSGFVVVELVRQVAQVAWICRQSTGLGWTSSLVRISGLAPPLPFGRLETRRAARGSWVVVSMRRPEVRFGAFHAPPE